MNSQFHEDYLRVSKPRFRIVGVRNDYTLLLPVNAEAVLRSKRFKWFYSDHSLVIGLYKGQIIKP